jgi:hypothetical protein
MEIQWHLCETVLPTGYQRIIGIDLKLVIINKNAVLLMEPVAN